MKTNSTKKDATPRQFHGVTKTFHPFLKTDLCPSDLLWRKEILNGRSPPTIAIPGGRCPQQVLVGMGDGWSGTVVIPVLSYGYRIPFQTPPPLTSLPREYLSFMPSFDQAHTLWGEVDKMLEKGAVETACDQVPAFYSRLSLMEKMTGGWRPVIDLLPLSKHVLLF